MSEYPKDKEKILARTKAWRENNPETYKAITRKSHLKKHYGMTIEDFDRLLEKQGGYCAICKTDSPGRNGRFNVDHDHKTGKIRGLLCNICNISLGGFKDSLEVLQNAVAYLKQSSE